MNIQALIDKRANLWDSAQKIIDERTSADGTLSAEDAAQYDKIEAEIESLGKQIDRFKRHEATNAKLTAPTTAPIRDAIGGNFDNDMRGIGNVKSGRATDEYKAAIMTALRSNFKQVSAYLNEGNSAQGGYLVPESWDSRLIDTIAEENVIRSLATIITTSSERKINLVASKPAAAWLDEGQALTFSNATFGQIVLDAHKLGVGVQVSEELLFDNAFDLENFLITEFGKALANAEEQAFISGAENANTPTGILTSIAKDTTAFKTTTGVSIAPDDIINLIYSLKRPYRKRAVFLANDSTVALVRKLKDANQAFMWQPSLQSGEPDRLLGYPIFTTPYMPAAASGEFALVFGDISYYNIGDRNARWIQELKEAYAVSGLVGYMMKERVDGILTLTEAVRALQIK